MEKGEGLLIFGWVQPRTVTLTHEGQIDFNREREREREKERERERERERESVKVIRGKKATLRQEQRMRTKSR